MNQAAIPKRFPNLWMVGGWHDENEHARKICEVVQYERDRDGRDVVRVRFLYREDLFDPEEALMPPIMLLPLLS